MQDQNKKPRTQASVGGSATRGKKYIVVTGGVMSGLGKGITSASIGSILKRHGFKVNLQKFDPYLNTDAGTLNPSEHGEVFVTDDGGETDLDLGHYERFLNQSVTKDSSTMAGSIYTEVIERERKGDYLGKTVQVIPHVTDAIKRRLFGAAEKSGCDVHIAEIGGTVGDYEGVVFLEAMRQLLMDVGRDNIVYIHLVFLPHLDASGEVKTKPAQNSVRDLRNIGIQPDVLIVRSDHAIPPKMIDKLAQFTNVPQEAIVPLPTLPSVYEVPLVMEKYGLDQLILRRFSMPAKKNPNEDWKSLAARIRKEKPAVKVAIIGKYLEMKDTYMSLVEAVRSAAWSNGRDPQIIWIDAEKIEKKEVSVSALKKVDAMIVPGGFGKRGTEGKIDAIRYARENGLPLLGICLGMQLMTVEFARGVAGLQDAHSEEFKPQAADKVIHFMKEQKLIERKGGTMRLGSWPCALKEGTLARNLYGSARIDERHRHRFEYNNEYRERLEKAGLMISGTSPDKQLVEIVELPSHPFFIGVQFHPEFKSRPLMAHPLFSGLIKAAIKAKKA